MIYVSIGTIEVDWNCHPETIFWVSEFKEGPLAAIGDNLRIKWPNWGPLIEINLSRIWDYIKGDFDSFINLLSRVWLHEYLHIELRMEATNPPSGRGTLPIEYKGKNEEKYIFNLVNELLGHYIKTEM